MVDPLEREAEVGLAVAEVLITADQRRIRAAYVGTFCVVLLYAEIPWTSLIVAGLTK